VVEYVRQTVWRVKRYYARANLHFPGNMTSGKE
jgi:hypothetical protein